MKDLTFIIRENRNIARDVYRMILEGDTSEISAPGQFVNIALPGRYLRRPISICDGEKDRLTLVYKVVGHGTEDLSGMQPGDSLQLLCALGNGYDLAAVPEGAVIAGGGVGIPPLYGLAKQLLRAGKHPRVLLGFNSAEDVFMVEAFRDLGLETRAASVDGTFGTKGLVTDLLREVPEDADNAAGPGAAVPGRYVLACGPEPMLRAVYGLSAGGQFSFESRMGCGFGACMGCSKRTKNGFKRICKDGPVFQWEEIIWEQ